MSRAINKIRYYKIPTARHKSNFSSFCLYRCQYINHSIYNAKLFSSMKDAPYMHISNAEEEATTKFKTLKLLSCTSPIYSLCGPPQKVTLADEKHVRLSKPVHINTLPETSHNGRRYAKTAMLKERKNCCKQAHALYEFLNLKPWRVPAYHMFPRRMETGPNRHASELLGDRISWRTSRYQRICS